MKNEYLVMLIVILFGMNLYISVLLSNKINKIADAQFHMIEGLAEIMGYKGDRQ